MAAVLDLFGHDVTQQIGQAVRPPEIIRSADGLQSRGNVVRLNGRWKGFAPFS